MGWDGMVMGWDGMGWDDAGMMMVMMTMTMVMMMMMGGTRFPISIYTNYRSSASAAVTW